ncbi:hypothetical protein SLEP1_g37581 [Rubroshorea leprosula]|uniref:Uncharacterized protein n=1 Tax=Rubroshorea leprosula TaxID=152421 RepID=A0AAV5KVG5_9ROSI|nr:hypothetical protein SLEP1_g37581 [Rubroshorea leprosula]
MDREKLSSKRSRDDRESAKDHRDHKHHGSHRDSDHHRRRSDRKSSRRDDRETSREREKSYDSRDEREGSRDRSERSYEPRIEREGSSDRDRESKRDRERKHREVKREGSYEEMESKGRTKRKERDESQERREKRARVSSDDGKERRRFEDGAKEGEGNRDENRERKRFEDKMKTEVDNGKEVKANYSESNVNNVMNDELTDATAAKGSVPVENGASHGSSSSTITVVLKNAESSKASDHHLTTKVSSTSSPNENKGVSITRSHEVIGTSSTDATPSAAGKNGGNLSLDAIAKAKKALQMQKELAEKLKKIPTLNKVGTSSSGAITGTVQGGTIPSSVAPTAVPTGTDATSSSSALLAVSPSEKPPASGVSGVPGLPAISNLEAVKRAQELAAKMGFRQDPQFAPLINLFPGQLPTEAPVAQKPTKAPVLRVDALGREIDEHGNVVNQTKPSYLSTLKVNINKQKKEAFQILKPELDVDPESNPHFDARMGINKNKLLRPKRMTFQFVEEGKWTKDAEIIKLKSQFGEAGAKELKAKQAQLAKVKADINPNLIEVSERVVVKEKPKDPIPEVEWWDLPLLATGSYGDAGGEVTEDKLKIDKITIYVEHPRPIEPPAEPAPPPPQPLKLTKKEQKKLRTQRRLAREKDRQEMIRQGLIEPPKPKVKLSNLMKVLGSEATQDPTKLEMEIRSAAAEREQAHVDRNIARKLTPAELREKKEKKLFDDPNTLEIIVSVYKINDLSHPKTRFKVDVNAQENRLTGCAVISEGMSIVIVEGGSKSIKRYGKLMLRRINWAEAVKEEEDDEVEDQDKPVNKCMLVWQGSVAKPSFHKFSVHECMTEAAARKIFSDAGVAHYWDLAVNFTED